MGDLMYPKIVYWKSYDPFLINYVECVFWRPLSVWTGLVLFYALRVQPMRIVMDFLIAKWNIDIINVYG